MSNNPTSDLVHYIRTVATMTGATLPTVEHWDEIRFKANECVVAPYGRDSVTKEPLPWPGIGGYYQEGYTRTIRPTYTSVGGYLTGRMIPIGSSEHPYYEFITTGVNDPYHGPLSGRGNMNAITSFSISFT